ncbi:hypothetical protein COB64_01265 [Candidatus Wolfebacteria bacterium]|nr:MAG: hypothetical protein COB64_01265 [Candidatus Wolfebacteria bacterium]
MNHLLKKHLLSVLAILLLIGFSVLYFTREPIQAAPPGSPFAIGETLDPACAPGDVNCKVDINLSSVLTSGNISDGSNIKFGTDTAFFGAFDQHSIKDNGGEFSISSAENLSLFSDGNDIIIEAGVVDILSPLQASGEITSSVGGFRFPDNTLQTTAATGGAGILKEVKLVIPGGDTAFSLGGTNKVLDLNSTPLELIPAPTGPGQAIEVISVFVGTDADALTTPYDKNTKLVVIAGPTDRLTFIDDSILRSTVGRNIIMGKQPSFGTTLSQIIENAAVNVTVLTGNPQNGDSPITIYALYRIVDL